MVKYYAIFLIVLVLINRGARQPEKRDSPQIKPQAIEKPSLSKLMKSRNLLLERNNDN